MESNIAGQHTLAHFNCPACQGLKSLYSQSFSTDMLFPEAAKLYMQLRSLPNKSGGFLKPGTEYEYQRYITSLSLFFGEMRLKDIKWFHLRAYQVARINGDEPFIRFRRPQDALPRKVRVSRGEYKIIPPVGKQPCPTRPQHVNQELFLLGAILKRAKLWEGELKDNYEELRGTYPEIPPALTPDQQKLWLNASRMNPKWELVHWYSVVAFDLTCSPNEMRAFRLGDINLHHGTITVPPEGIKVAPRGRTLTLDNADCIWALKQLISRAVSLGAKDALHYLFPFGERITRNTPTQGRVVRNFHAFDPTRPMTVSGLNHSWKEMQQATGLVHFDVRDTRHTGITRMAEWGYPIPVIMARAGHMSPRMTQHYTQVSLMAQRHWSQIADQRRQTDMERIAPQTDWGYSDRRVV